jgi:hypothetical protein
MDEDDEGRLHYDSSGSSESESEGEFEFKRSKDIIFTPQKDKRKTLKH